MKRLINYLFFTDEIGKLQRVVPLCRLADSQASEALISALFDELFTPYYQLKKSQLIQNGEFKPAEVDLMLEGCILTMNLYPVQSDSEEAFHWAVSFFDGGKQPPSLSPSYDLTETSMQKEWSELSHEIKNSVNIIQGISDLMKVQELGENRDLMPHLESSIKYLKSLVMNYLIDQKSQTLRWEKSVFYLREELEELVEQFMFLNKAGGHSFEFGLEEDIPRAIKGYPVALRQVLINLLFNALEHSSIGKIKLRVSRVWENGIFIRLKFSVEDSGKEILGDEEIKISKGNASLNNSKKKGFGLGLKICQKILRSMDSEVLIQGGQGEGTQFSFILEFLKADLEEHSLPWEIGERTEDLFFLGKKALIVDDNPLNRLIAQKYLNQLGFCTQVTSEGISALQKLHESEFDLLILDIILPGLDGKILLGIIRPRFPKLKIILSSGDSLYRQNLSLHQSSKVTFLEKPYEKKDLERILRIEFAD